MNLEIITIGNELLLGYTIDTNAAWLARRLSEIGVRVVRRATVSDDAGAIAGAVREAVDRTGAVITTGGLGPTADDRTRPAIAGIFGLEMHEDPELRNELIERFRSFGYVMPASNLGQAMVPVGASVMRNQHGSAPGLWIEDEHGRWVAMLPGVPREMRGLSADELLPRIAARVGAGAAIVRSRTIRTTGIGESALAELLGDVMWESPGFALASLPGWEGTDLRMTVSDMSSDAAEETLQRVERVVRERAARFVYAVDDEDLASIVLDRVRERKLKLATAESCTGGMLGARITAIPGSSDVYVGGVVAYANEVKTDLLAVNESVIREHGAVSEEVVLAMAIGTRERFGVDAAMAITGVAGPGGGTAEKPVGMVWVAASVDQRTEARSRVLPGDRDEIRRRAAQGALDLLRHLLERLD